MSDLVRNPEDRFSHIAAHLLKKSFQTKALGECFILRNAHCVFFFFFFFLCVCVGGGGGNRKDQKVGHRKEMNRPCTLMQINVVR